MGRSRRTSIMAHEDALRRPAYAHEHESTLIAASTLAVNKWPLLFAASPTLTKISNKNQLAQAQPQWK